MCFLKVGKGIIGSIARQSILLSGWEMNTKLNWSKIRGQKFIINHPMDLSIPKGSRLVDHLEKDKKSFNLIKMRCLFSNKEHTRHLNAQESLKYLKSLKLCFKSFVS